MRVNSEVFISVLLGPGILARAFVAWLDLVPFFELCIQLLNDLRRLHLNQMLLDEMATVESRVDVNQKICLC